MSSLGCTRIGSNSLTTFKFDKHHNLISSNYTHIHIYSAWLFFDENFKEQNIFFNSKSNQWEEADILQKIMRDYAGDESLTIIKIMKSSLSENEKLNGVARVILYGN